MNCGFSLRYYFLISASDSIFDVEKVKIIKSLFNLLFCWFFGFYFNLVFLACLRKICLHGLHGHSEQPVQQVINPRVQFYEDVFGPPEPSEEPRHLHRQNIHIPL